MRVRLLTSLSFGAGLVPVGDEVDVTPEQAQALISHGLAEEVDIVESTPQATAVEAGDEQAVMPRARKR